MPGFRVYMFGSIPFPVPAAEVERGMSCVSYNVRIRRFRGRIYVNHHRLSDCGFF